MTLPPPSENPSQDPQTPAPVAGAAELAEQLNAFWEKNRNLILGGCAAILLAILVREGWEAYSAARDRDVRAAFATATGETAKLTRFASENSGHPLAGAARLLVADQKFESRDYQGAADDYRVAIAALELPALKGRARLGEAMSRVLGGDVAAGESALKALSSDATLPSALRAEATYHLASLAVEAGRTADAVKLVEEISRIDSSGLWARQGAVLRASLELAAPATPASPAGIPAPSTETPLFKPGGK